MIASTSILALMIGSVAANRRRSGGLSIGYDNRFGTDATTAAATGWFTFGLHSGNRRVWVDGSKADDTGNGLTAATAKKTFDAGWAVFSGAGFTAGDQLMVAGSNTYTNHATGYLANLGGISATYPTAIISYDATDASNAAKYGKLTGNNMPVIKLDNVATYGNSFCNPAVDGNNYYAFQGIAFDGQDIDGNGIAWQPRHDGLVWQNCRFNNVGVTITSGGSYDPTGTSYNQTGNISKCAFYGQWVNTGTNTSGVYLHGTKDFYLQDNVFAHCGWRIGSCRDDVIRSADGGATWFNHGNYVSASETGIRLDRNFYTDTAADGFNLRSNGDATSIVSLDEPIAGNVGGFSGSVHEAPNGVVAHVTDWLIMGGADITSFSGYHRGEAVWTTNTVGDSFLKNIAAFDSPKFGVDGDQLLVVYNGNNQNIMSITPSGTTATLTTEYGHGLVTGDHINVAGVTPSAYNVSNAAITVIDATHFTYTTATTPAGNATISGSYVVGNYTPQCPQQLLVDHLRSYNYARVGAGGTPAVPSIVTNTYTNSISDDPLPGGTNQTASSGLFPSYKTRDQVVTAVLNGIGITPGSSYFARKAQLVNAAVTRPDLPWSQWLIGVGLPAMGLTPTYTAASYQTYTDTPLTVYKTALNNLTIGTTTFVRGTAAQTLLAGVGYAPVLTAQTALPSGFTLQGRLLSYDGTGSGAATPSITIRETSADGSVFHDTVFALTINAGSTPTLSSPTASSTGTTTASIGVTTDTGSGTLYYVITNSATPPSAVQIKAGQNNTGSAAVLASSQAVSATGVQSASITGLAASTTYYAYFVQHTTVDSNVASAASFTTSAGSFTPASLTGLNLWIEPDTTTLFTDAGSTHVTADGQAVQQWNDKSSSARNLSAGGSQKPLYKTDLSKPSILFDGVDDLIATAGDVAWVDGSGQQWFALSMQSSNVSSNLEIATIKHSDSTYNCDLYTGGGTAHIENLTSSTYEEDSTAASTLASNTPVVIIATVTSTQMEVWVNNVSNGAHTNVGTPSTVSGSMRLSGGGSPWPGRIFGLVHGTGTLSSTDRANLQTYLAALHP